MEVLLTVEVAPAAGRPRSHDLAIDVEPEHSVAQLTAALVAAVGSDLSDDAPVLVRGADGAYLSPDDRLGDAGLVNGETLRLGPVRTVVPAPRRPPRRSEAPTHALVVTSGPDVGERVDLGEHIIRIGRDPSCDLALSDPTLERVHLVAQRDEAMIVTLTTASDANPEGAAHNIHVDGERIDGVVTVETGQLVRIGATTLRLTTPTEPPGAAGHTATGAAAATTSPAVDRDGEAVLGRVGFHRSPYYPAPVGDQHFDALGEIPQSPEHTPFAYLAALVPLVVGVTLGLLISWRFMIFAALTPVMAVAAWFDNRRRTRKRHGLSEVRFRQRLAQRRSDVTDALAVERSRRFLSAPDLATLAARARERSIELWVRDRTAVDGLTVRLGLGAVAPRVSVAPETTGDDELRDEVAADMAALLRMGDVPVTVDLAPTGVLGIVGPRRDGTALASSLLAQLACLHSPDDVILAAALARPSGLAGWLRWLPHVRAAGSPLPGRHVAVGAAEAADLLKHLIAVAETRHDTGGSPAPAAGSQAGTGSAGISGGSGNAGNSGGPWPRVVVVVAAEVDVDPALASRLLELGPSAGISIVWLAERNDDVPRQAAATVRCRSLLADEPSILTHTDPDRNDQELWIEWLAADRATAIARDLAPLYDASSPSSAATMPRIATLFDAFGIDAIDADRVEQHWASAPPGHVVTPIGVGVGGPVVIDLIEHGPHGLVAGTSGSGKSELVTSLVAGLMAHHPPDQVTVLFIDYKGGALAEQFALAPHTVGRVTNLDPLLAKRALTSLRAELNHRMGLLKGQARDLAELMVTSPEDAPPALVIVIDEFATLVSEIPDFVAGIIDIAQRGRSLGIHLVLATQRPSGAVNENILANTNLRISLRMLDNAESQAVIGAPDAAAIPAPLRGRGFARLGPGELVPFQSAWSGAALETDPGPVPVVVRAMDAAGRPADALGPAQSVATRRTPATHAARTQLDETLAAIVAAGRRANRPPARSPWLDELPTVLDLTAVRAEVVPTAEGDDAGLVVPIGLVDDPEAQDQYPAVIDFEAGGGVMVLGAGGSGKTTALRTLATAAALGDSDKGCGRSEPRDCDRAASHSLTIVGFDFASRELTALSALPQCVDVATGDDLELVTRLIALLGAEVERRRAQMEAAIRAGEPPPDLGRVLIVIDDYGALASTLDGAGANAGAAQGLYVWLDTLNRVIVEGRQVGVHTALSALRRAEVRSGVAPALANRLVLRQSDPTAYAELGVGSAAVEIDLPSGRGFLNGDALVQVAVIDTDPDRAAQQHAVRTAASGLTGTPAPSLVSDPLPTELAPLPPTGERGEVVLGVADLTGEPVVIGTAVDDVAVVGPPHSGRSNALAGIAWHLARSGLDVWAVGPPTSPVATTPGLTSTAFGPPHEVGALLDMLVADLEQRSVTDRASVVLVIDDVDRFDDVGLDATFSAVTRSGVRWVAATGDGRGFSTNPFVMAIRKARTTLVLQPDSGREVSDITGARVELRAGLTFPPGRGVVVAERQATVVQVAFTLR
ncbi:MAG: FtsK/SpoIIIE domain-containing protein [Actinomycetota bacterium]